MARALVLLLFLAMLAAACGGDDDDDSETPRTPTEAETETSTAEPTEPAATETPTTEPDDNVEAPSPPQGLDLRWPDILGEVPADGVLIEVGAGAGTFLRVSDDAGQVLGHVEILSYPIDTFTIFTSDDQSENYQALVADYYQVFDTFSCERAESRGSPDDRVCGAGYEFQADEPQEAPVGGLTGVRFGFTGVVDGQVVERHVNYAVFQGEFLYIMVAHYDQADPEQSWTSADDLESFISTFDELVANLLFPVS